MLQVLLMVPGVLGENGLIVPRAVEEELWRGVDAVTVQPRPRGGHTVRGINIRRDSATLSLASRRELPVVQILVIHSINRLILELFTYLTTGPFKCRETPAVTKQCSRKKKWRRRWTYDKGACRKFPYQCKRNGNNFKSKAKCEKTCSKSHKGW